MPTWISLFRKGIPLQCRAENINFGVCWLWTQLMLWAWRDHLEGGCQSSIEQSLSVTALSVLGQLVLCCKVDLCATGCSVADLTSDLQDSRSTLYHKLTNKVFPDVANCASIYKAAPIWDSPAQNICELGLWCLFWLWLCPCPGETQVGEVPKASLSLLPFRFIENRR